MVSRAVVALPVRAKCSIRIVPLFPELRDLLRDAFEIAEEGAVFVLPNYRSPSKNFRTRMLKIIKRAGLKSWPKLFQNLRSTRQTELEEEFPTHVVCSWMGNSESVARKNYLQVTEDHYDRAITMVQNQVQKAAEGGGNAPNQQERALTINSAKTNKPRVSRGLLITGAACATGAVAEEGLELPINFQGKTYILTFAGDSRGIISPKGGLNTGKD